MQGTLFTVFFLERSVADSVQQQKYTTHSVPEPDWTLASLITVTLKLFVWKRKAVDF